MSLVIYNRKRKRKKTMEKLFKNPKETKTFDLSSQNDNIKKIHLCNVFFKSFWGIYFRESALFFREY